jgi:hypothetical protein
MISGTMPQWQKNVHRFGIAITWLLLGGVGLANFHSLSLARGPRAVNGVLFVTFWLIVAAAVGIGTQLWYWRRMVSEFTYDGGALRFRTLGRASTQTRALPEIADIREWRGRGSTIGYRLTFRDGAKIYLQNTVANSTALAEQIQRYAGLSRAKI